MSGAEIEAMNRHFRQWLQREDPLKSVEKKQHNKALVADGVGTTEGTCSFCSKKDCIYPVSGLHICPKCMKGGDWSYRQIQLVKSGKCDICGCNFEGAGAYIAHANACIRCLWVKLGHKHGALRTDGGRLV